MTGEWTWLGRQVRRIEDPKLLQGKGAYLDDLNPGGVLHVALVRSPHAHARIVEVDASEALRQPGVVQVLLAQDLGIQDVPVIGPPGTQPVPHPVLAREVVRYVGQPVAAVLAESQAAAEDGAAAVRVAYESMEAVVDPLEALEGRRLVHPHLGNNVGLRLNIRQGEVEEAFRNAARVVRQRMWNQRLAAAPMEPRGVLAEWDGVREQLTVWASTQLPHSLRDTLARALKLDVNQVRVITPDVGGGFGLKLNACPEDVLVAHLAQRLGRPVKWVERRSESMVASAHGRSQLCDLELACDERARVIGLRAHIVGDLGAYAVTTTLVIAGMTARMLTGPYRIPAVDIEVVGVYTNKTPSGAYRGAGRPEATYYLERGMDLVAREFGLDPVEVRRRNLLPKGAFPYRTPTGLRYDSGDYHRALRVLLEKADYRKLREEQERARREGRYLGIGLSTYVEICAFGWEWAKVRLNADGTAVVFTGTSPHGQGDATGFAQIAAERLGIDPYKVRVVHGDTLAIPVGGGTGGSRTLVVGGSAILKASEKVRRKLLRIAAHLLEAPVRDLELRDGRVLVRGVPDRSLSVAEVAAAAYQPMRLPKGMEPGLEESATFSIPSNTFPFGAHLCVVEVDRETGEVFVRRYVAVDDVGVMINPLLVAGQIQGGIVQALGQALLEEVVYDPSGQPLVSSLADYSIPRAAHVPPLELYHTVTPSPTNPLGAKGVGESGTIGGTPAFVNAVVDALAPLGVRHLDMPLRPEKLWRILQQASVERRVPTSVGSPKGV
ncbi:MAG: xanthine dehydrogenase family protein molybdopterin-binding subunit [Armatimonadota bacterium]|nr:xanthine dehydrogenase family protein molybdopterin-binding subunit [Armatimonadota bacterium]MDR7439372.1 xanthine dehydrogenase family protein molybdopterin-binding subunit [Armatimonadota bacterium]MDR7563211.1 xanthine dehydrogenase family protein molybdopterin-binding subunit [Armatimonadota bacterium]MDR7567956.1 xanthine dehydrogenase family protein molybdopterin-binding subunit [Armatimonadota bacterium]MDR7601885.1 xanthine dehydrogenase family protein molybdopterin-binding subunit 